MSARHTADNIRKDYRPLVLLVWALFILFLHLTRFSPYTPKGSFQPPEENHYFAWIQSNTVLDNGLYLFSSGVELERFYRQNDDYSLSLINKPGFDAMELVSAKHQLKEKPMVSPMVAPLFFQPVSINDASAEILETLPGIGKKLAGRIIEHRQELGFFQGLDDLLAVKGIGEKKLNRLRTLISLE